MGSSQTLEMEEKVGEHNLVNTLILTTTYYKHSLLKNANVVLYP